MSEIFSLQVRIVAQFRGQFRMKGDQTIPQGVVVFSELSIRELSPGTLALEHVFGARGARSHCRACFLVCRSGRLVAAFRHLIE